MKVQNHTRFPAELTVVTDKTGAQRYLLVVKATFDIPVDGPPRPAERQVPFFYADQHYGDPATTSIRYESEFAPHKPRADVVLVGSAHAPGGRARRSLVVEMRVAELRKRIRVTGDRVWRSLGLWSVASRPRPFQALPLVYERAFGGADTSHRNPRKHRFDRRNLCGVGLQRGRSPKRARGKPLPNLEPVRRKLRRPGARIAPAGFGFVGRAWLPRADFAGTYDDHWKDHRFPLLPSDFDERYFQGAPADQTRAYLRGGERVVLTHLDPSGRLEFDLPDLTLPVRFLYVDREEEVTPVADTLILEPDERRFQVIWRATRPMEEKLLDLGEVDVGRPTRGFEIARSSMKRLIEKKVQR